LNTFRGHSFRGLYETTPEHSRLGNNAGYSVNGVRTIRPSLNQ